MEKHFLIALFFLPLLLSSQVDTESSSADANYLEDQFYLGVNYNFMLKKPDDVFKRNFSYGLQIGFIKDLPLNDSRTIALGLGLGYAVNSYYSNLIVTNENDVISYYAESDASLYDRSKFELHSIELPFELRWRNSSPTKYKFLRIYSGVKFAYNFSARSKLVTSTERLGFSNPDLERLQYGLTLNLGYNTFNLHLYYSLSDFLKKDTQLDTGEAIAINSLRVGLIFYIL
ncbi:PorT family protein [Cellulophaga sp. E16_2]|uniref:Outer membrane insertion C-terminal signal protein n=1 Tax=Cellulophaga algicola (strain DSM 14237 / IC166 / ACAM 630) TaxID=688270 RepID=E6X407_CELAD|nr:MULTISPECIES: porin family protein [Cellulophaga]ADV49332.1 outer membrane insertion C-terminal signal protein [Cellulophaga algicola DSM 14237]MBO0591783.1 PorT family protein [Cellulophaga sp. E16_2]